MADDVNVTIRILDKLNKIEDIALKNQLNIEIFKGDIKTEIVDIKADLREHIRRTGAVEKTNELLEAKIEQQKDHLQARLNKLEKWSDKFHFLGWLIAGILGLLEASGHIEELLRKL